MTTDLMKELEGLEQNALNELAGAAHMGEGVELPFDAIYLWAQNGDAKMVSLKASAPALYFGGWATDAVKWQELELPMLDGMTQFLGQGKSEKTWDGLCTRELSFAYIGRRMRWLSKGDGVQTYRVKYDEQHQRRHVQILGVLYAAKGPLCACVLSAKGYQAGNLLNAIATWDKETRPARKELNASQIPISAFVLTIGTRGDKREIEKVGKGTTQNEITPLRALLPDKLTADVVKKRFVGGAMIRENAERLVSARDWLNAWKEQENQPQAPYPGEIGEEVAY